MRLTIELLQQPSPPELADLSKIWPDKAAADFLQHEEDSRYYVARFNQRLLAGLEIQLLPSEAVISQIMVREATRRRGIGRYLLEETLRMNPDVQRWRISPDQQPLSWTASMFLYACGFRSEQGIWIFSH